MTHPKHSTPEPAAGAPDEPFFIEEGDDDPLTLAGHIPPYPMIHRASELYDIREGETLREAMDRASQESVAAAEAQARNVKQP